jgi:hypothetical protein
MSLIATNLLETQNYLISELTSTNERIAIYNQFTNRYDLFSKLASVDKINAVNVEINKQLDLNRQELEYRLSTFAENEMSLNQADSSYQLAVELETQGLKSIKTIKSLRLITFLDLPETAIKSDWQTIVFDDNTSISPDTISVRHFMYIANNKVLFTFYNSTTSKYQSKFFKLST